MCIDSLIASNPGRGHSRRSILARFSIALFALLAALSAMAEPREAFIDPVITGPGIRPLLDLPGAASRDLRHFVAIDSAKRNGFLYVHLPGSGGLPENSLTLLRFAAELGFHAVSLAYPNWPSVGELTSSSGSAAAPGAVRQERLFGVDTSPLVQVDPANSVENRLTQLLLYLQLNDPGEQWRRFIRDDKPVWSRIVVGGHSQGAGHAAYLAQEFPLAGALILGGPGDFVQGFGPADWVYRPLVTDVSSLFGLVHQDDPSYLGFQVIQVLLGMGEAGPVQDVDLIASEDWTSRRLTSSRLDIPEANFHGAVVVDGSLPINPDGSPGYLNAWRYMLSSVLFSDSFGD